MIDITGLVTDSYELAASDQVQVAVIGLIMLYKITKLLVGTKQLQEWIKKKKLEFANAILKANQP